MPTELPAPARRVRDALHAAGLDIEIVATGASARTAEEAAAAVGAPVGAIVKSLVFLSEGQPVLLLVSGANRVAAKELGLKRADAEQVRAATGYAIGGIPPIAHSTTLHVRCDEDLLTYDVVWAAAGTPDHVFAIAPAELVRVTGAEVGALAARPPS